MTRPDASPAPRYDRAEPHASALIESLRAFGYTPQAAAADIIDNAVSAQARTIRLNFQWNGEHSSVSFLDDGTGMTAPELVEAMRPGGRGPLDARAAHDLGRFGLGLKTASFSQCRRLTVATRRAGGAVVIRRWDLDYVGQMGEWRLLHDAHPGSESLLEPLRQLPHGTMVLWEQLDRLAGGSARTDARAHKRFLAMTDTVENHLGMVFHRFLEGRGRLQMFVNGQPVLPWDPFLCRHRDTQYLPPEGLRHHGHPVSIEPFVLPHRSRLSADEYTAAAGPGGWNAQQGFYVYRNDRILVAGHWLGLGFQKDEHYRLARIRVDIPSALDAAWDIDVRKSRARPPGSLREDFVRIARLTRERAVEVYRRKGRPAGRSTATSAPTALWEARVGASRTDYVINRDHPLVTAVAARLGPDAAALRALLGLLERTVPVERIWLDVAEHPDQPTRPFEGIDPAEIESLARDVYQTLRASGLDQEAARRRLEAMPFGERPDIVTRVLQEERK
ncbi:ATP-binding protein [Deinococcus hopiensis]|nr:ATP-binding protein [Deinococcus hopiensis]